MVGTTKHAVKISLVRNALDWEEELPQVLYEYRRCERGTDSSPLRLIYGINLGMTVSDAVAVLTEAEPKHRLAEVFG